jgi:hypothetical protein
MMFLMLVVKHDSLEESNSVGHWFEIDKMEKKMML